MYGASERNGRKTAATLSFKNRPNENLRLKLLEKLLGDEIRLHEKKKPGPSPQPA